MEKPYDTMYNFARSKARCEELIEEIKAERAVLTTCVHAAVALITREGPVVMDGVVYMIDDDGGIRTIKARSIFVVGPPSPVFTTQEDDGEVEPPVVVPVGTHETSSEEFYDEEDDTLEYDEHMELRAMWDDCLTGMDRMGAL